MSNSYSIRVNVDLGQPMMIVFALLFSFLDCRLDHDYDPVTNVAGNHVYPLKHYRDLDCLVEKAFHLLRHLVQQLAIEQAVIHVYYPAVDMIHRRLLLVAVIAANGDVPDWPMVF